MVDFVELHEGQEGDFLAFSTKMYGCLLFRCIGRGRWKQHADGGTVLESWEMDILYVEIPNDKINGAIS